MINKYQQKTRDLASDCFFNREEKYIMGVDPVTDNATSAKVVDGILQYDIKTYSIDAADVVKHFKSGLTEEQLKQVYNPFK